MTLTSWRVCVTFSATDRHVVLHSKVVISNAHTHGLIAGFIHPTTRSSDAVYCCRGCRMKLTCFTTQNTVIIYNRTIPNSRGLLRWSVNSIGDVPSISSAIRVLILLAVALHAALLGSITIIAMMRCDWCRRSSAWAQPRGSEAEFFSLGEWLLIKNKVGSSWIEMRKEQCGTEFMNSWDFYWVIGRFIKSCNWTLTHMS